MERFRKFYSFMFYSVSLLFISYIFDDLFLEIVASFKNIVFDYLLTWASREITVTVFFFIMTSLFLWEEKKRDYIVPLWLSFITTLVVTTVLKLLFMRDRPFYTEIVPLMDIISYSFPSGHVAICFSALPVLDREFPKIKWFWIIFALAVAFARLYFGLHYLSDIIAGMILGYGIGFLLLNSKLRRI